jgi:hypothetical protein
VRKIKGRKKTKRRRTKNGWEKSWKNSRVMRKEIKCKDGIK